MPLKEGGHHRKAVDLAAKKKALKNADKQSKAAAGERGQILAKVLKLDPDVDIYLEAASTSSSSQPLCHAHFRFDNCSNRRCKLSHEYTIADATTNGSGGGGAMENTGSNCAGEIPALELVAGILSSRPSKKRRPIGTPTPGAGGWFESLPDLIGVESIVAFCESNADIFNTMRTCRFLRASLMNCGTVERRRRAGLEMLLQKRNSKLVGKASASRLRFAVSYRGACAAANNTEGGKDGADEGQGVKKGNKKGGGKAGKKGGGRLRPTLAYDHENASVFQSFQRKK